MGATYTIAGSEQWMPAYLTGLSYLDTTSSPPVERAIPIGADGNAEFQINQEVFDAVNGEWVSRGVGSKDATLRFSVPIDEDDPTLLDFGTIYTITFTDGVRDYGGSWRVNSLGITGGGKGGLFHRYESVPNGPITITLII